jgi:RsiW-degrading membrane proteinase PrsW (M82 family)
LFLIALIASALSAAVWLLVIRRYDRLQPEPLKTMLWVGLAAGFLAVIVAGPLNSWVMFNLSVASGGRETLGGFFILAVFVGINEEVWKGLFTMLLMKRHKEVDEPVDGMIYAMTASLGFAALENILYMLENGLGVIVIRSLLSVPAHLACGAIWGYGYSKVRFLEGKKELMPHVLPWLLLAAAGHAVYDLLAFTGVGLILIVPLLFIMWRYVHRRLKALAALNPQAVSARDSLG